MPAAAVPTETTTTAARETAHVSTEATYVPAKTTGMGHKPTAEPSTAAEAG